jgi:phosphoserine phosphatase
VEFHRSARGFALDDCIAIGDSIEDLESAVSVGRFFAVANGPARDEEMRAALSRFPNASVTEAEMGDGFYEAVVSTLAMRG